MGKRLVVDPLDGMNIFNWRFGSSETYNFIVYMLGLSKHVVG